VETASQLIEDFQAMSCLWDVASMDYKNRNKRRMPRTNLQSNTVCQIQRWKKKIHNLKSQFRQEHKKLKESKKKWFFPFKLQLVRLPTVIISTQSDGVKRQLKHRL
jgi:hypothetical protein